ncbi:MAG: dipeptide/oligopeptide/nickel ABC transporter ATP-binding protein [Pirellulales bacterium]
MISPATPTQNSAAPTTPLSTGEPLLEVRRLQKYFPVRRGVFGRVRQWVKAVDDVSFTLGRGETLGLVGESGCGKTTVGRTVLRLTPATGGEVVFAGRDILNLPRGELHALRPKVQIIFQDPYGSLNPRMTVGNAIAEPLRIHGLTNDAGRKYKPSATELRERVGLLLQQVGMPTDAQYKYPHEFSGGQRQRIGIARALALKPSFIVCDEPTSALDVSVRA